MPATPIIHLVRHAQGFHNLGAQFHSLPDPRLTPEGEKQCATLQSTHFPAEKQSNISLVTASPLSRTLNTAFLTFSPALSNGKCVGEIFAIPDAQETSDFPCDTGSEPEVLKEICREHGWPADLSLVKAGWNVKTLDSRYSPASRALEIRARDTRRLLREKVRNLAASGDEAVEVVLVTHGAFLHYLTADWEDANKYYGTGWYNTEYRTYSFQSDFASEDDTDAFFVETTESRKRRGKDHPMFDQLKQKQIFQEMMNFWAGQGLQTPLSVESAQEDQVKMEQESELEGQVPAGKNMSLDEKTGEIEVVA